MDEKENGSVDRETGEDKGQEMNEQQQRSFNAILQALNIMANAHIANVQGEQPAPQPEPPVDK